MTQIDFNGKLGESRFNARLITWAILGLFFGVSLFLRIFFLYHDVFTNSGIKFTTNDAYYHMRLVDNLVHNFPHALSFDPFMIYPGGYSVPSANLFDRFLAGISWVLGLGSPTQHLVDVIGVYLPPIIGALTIIPVYFLGKELLNRWAGIIAAGLISILPGAFMLRTTLGNTTYHGTEVLLTAILMMFLLLAVKIAGQRPEVFAHLRRKNWALIAKPSMFALLAGFFLAIYFFTWPGALLFTLIITVYFVLQFIVDHLRRRNTDGLCLVGTLLFLPVVIASLIVPQDMFHLIPNLVALAVPPILFGISRTMTTRRINPAYYPLAILGLGLVGLGILHTVNPSLLSSMSNTILNFFSPYGGLPSFSATVEMQPLLSPQGHFTLALAWYNYGTSFFVGLVGIVALLYLFITRREAKVGLILVWTLVILAATIAQRRYAYYLAVNISLVAGYFCCQTLVFAFSKNWGLRFAKTTGKRPNNKTKRADSPVNDFSVANRWIAITTGFLFTFGLLFYPLVGPLPNGQRLVLEEAHTPQFPLPDAWASALTWLRQNTPDPFGNPNFYYESYKPPASGETYAYPTSAYGVMSWWDFGYWIVRIAHRLPNVNPGEYRQPEFDVARFLMSQDESSADKIVQKLNSQYIIVDYSTDIDYSDSIAQSAGLQPADLSEVYYLPQNNQLTPVTLFYPESYTSMVSRLYAFDGQANTQQSPLVVSYEEKTNDNGVVFKQITSAKTFTTYSAALDYVSSQKTGNYRIVGTNPFRSPVPLSKLDHYKLIYASSDQTALPGGGTVPSVKIFQYAP